MVNAAWPEPALRDLEPASLAEQHVFGGHADILKDHLHMAVRGVVVTEDGQRPDDLDSWRVERHQDHRMAAVLLGVRVGDAKEDDQPTMRIADTGDPPFPSIENVIVAVAPDRGPDVRGITRRDVRFGHRESGTRLSGEQVGQPFAFLPIGAVADQRLDIAGVRRGTVEHLGGKMHPPHDLAQRGILHVGETRAVFGIRQEQVPEAGVACLLLQLLQNRRMSPAVGGDLVVITPLVGIDMRGHEGFEAPAQVARAVAWLEVHAVRPRAVRAGCP